MSRIQVLYIVRHGQRYDWQDPEWSKKAERWWDTPLSSHGLSQADETAAFLKADCSVSLSPTPPCTIISSPLLRAVQTAAATSRATGLPVRLERGMTEWPVNAPLETEQMAALFEPGIVDTAAPTMVDPPLNPQEDIPSAHVRGAAVYAAMLAAEASGALTGTVMVFGHAASCIALTRAALGDPKRAVDLPVCSVTKLVRTGPGANDWCVALLASTSHLRDGPEHSWSFEYHLEQQRLLRASPPPPSSQAND